MLSTQRPPLHPHFTSPFHQQAFDDFYSSTSLQRSRRDPHSPFDFDAPAQKPAYMSHNFNHFNWQDGSNWNNSIATAAPQFEPFGQHQQQQQHQSASGNDWSYDFTAAQQLSQNSLSQQQHAFHPASQQQHHQQHQQQQPLQPQPQRKFNSQLHRRALSNSSAGTYESGSPFTQPSPLPQYQNPALLQAPQHYPTPVHSPIRDAQSMAAGGKRRSQSSIRADNAAAAGNVMRSVMPSRPSRPSSGHSSYGHDMPVTPQTTNGDDQHEQKYGSVMHKPPTFDRTMTEIYADELYDPHQQFTSAAEQPPLPLDYHTNFLTPNRQVQQAINAANHAHAASPGDDPSMRAVSPFRKNSEFFTGSRMQTASAARQQQKVESDRLAYQQHHQLHRENSDQKTISPKDAVLDYNAAEDNPSLFSDAPMYGPHNANNNDARRSQSAQNFNFQAGGNYQNGESKYGPASFNQSNSNDTQEQSPDFPAHLVSMETSRSDSTDAESSQAASTPVHRPADTSANGGTYTCTYHGCVRRFESPSKLQKHKREDHRSTGHGQAHGLNIPTSGPQAMTQAGPHKCSRINPQTGKPCNVVFSRPYDLTRHEDTIHNRQKTKVKCPYCTEDKTFSRNDALTRHLKVVHPQVPLTGKHRKV